MGASAAVALVAAGLARVGFVAPRAGAAASSSGSTMPQPPKLPIDRRADASRPTGATSRSTATDATGKTRIWVRPLERARRRSRSPGTEGATRPFWSPDSRFLGFFADGKLKKIDVAGGPPQKVCDAPTGADGSLERGGRDPLRRRGQRSDPRRSRPAAASRPTSSAIEKSDRSGLAAVPSRRQALPLRRHRRGQGGDPDRATLDGQNVRRRHRRPVARRVRRRPATSSSCATRRSSRSRFDASSAKPTGEPVPLAEEIGTDNVGPRRLLGLAQRASSPTAPGAPGSRSTSGSIARASRAGVADEAGDFGNADLSPDGRWLAYQVGVGTDADLWVRDLKRGVSSRFTFDKGGESSPLFSRDSRRVVFQRREEGKPSRIVERSLDRTGEERLLFDATRAERRRRRSPPTRKSLIFQRQLPDKPWQIWTLPTGQPGQAKVVVGSEFSTPGGTVSPDGRWLVFESTESGAPEIYVVGFAGRVRPLADLDPRRRGAGLGAGRQGAVLSLAREQADAGRRSTTGASFDAASPSRSSP